MSRPAVTSKRGDEGRNPEQCSGDADGNSQAHRKWFISQLDIVGTGRNLHGAKNAVGAEQRNGLAVHVRPPTRVVRLTGNQVTRLLRYHPVLKQIRVGRIDRGANSAS